MPTIDIEKAVTDLNSALKEAAYVAVGLGVLGFQRAQVQRVELGKQLADLGAQLSSLPADVLPYDGVDAATVLSQLTELAKSVDEAVSPVRQQLEDQLDRLEEVLPAAARDFVQSLRAAVALQEHSLRRAVGL